ncbi:MAG: AbrB/MazE/SpoVT family DNA-binding domain-containing protein [Nanoarchaeota archaeon]
MKRKIIKQGHNTLTITLPNEWVKKLGLKPGEEIDVAESEDQLIINGHQNNKESSCVIDINNFTVPLLWRYFQSAYRAGCSEIKILFDPSKKDYEGAFHFYTTQFDYASLGEKIPTKSANVMLQEMVNRFIGIDIMETGKGYCIIKQMAEVTPKEFENSLRRIFLVIIELLDRLIDALENDEIGDPMLCNEVHNIDLSVDKLVDYCCRILNSVTGIVPERKKSLLFSSLFILELVGDECKYIAKHLALSKKNVKDCVELAALIKEHFEMYYKLYYKFSRDSAIKFGENDFKVYKENFKMKEKFHGESRSISRHLMVISKFTLALTELRIQMEF